MWIETKGLRLRAECLLCRDGEVHVNEDGELECPSCLRTWFFDDIV